MNICWSTWVKKGLERQWSGFGFDSVKALLAALNSEAQWLSDKCQRNSLKPAQGPVTTRKRPQETEQTKDGASMQCSGCGVGWGFKAQP